jgi:DNA-binding winged helix-turn-helix (wHTH) protein
MSVPSDIAATTAIGLRIERDVADLDHDERDRPQPLELSSRRPDRLTARTVTPTRARWRRLTDSAPGRTARGDSCMQRPPESPQLITRLSARMSALSERPPATASRGAHCATARLGPRRIPVGASTEPRTAQSALRVARLGDRCCADSTFSYGNVRLGRMREEATRPEIRQSAIELPQPAVVLVGDAARDHQRIDDLLAVDAIVILVPSLQTVTSLLPGGGSIAPVMAPSGASVGELRVDLTQHRVLWGEHELWVTERELAILALLSEEPGRARTFGELAEPEGDRWLGDTERVRSAVRRLRRKLARAGADARIESVRGYGFRLVNSSVDFASKNSPRAEGRPESLRPPASATESGSTTLSKRRLVGGLIHMVSPVRMARRLGHALPPLPFAGRHAHLMRLVPSGLAPLRTR